MLFFVLVSRYEVVAFDPLLNVESCTRSKLVVSTYGAAEGGLIYIYGMGEACKQVTTQGTALYEFDIVNCGIEWEELFKIVVQKNRLYQTGADKVIPIFCIADRSDLIINTNNMAGELADAMMVNLTVRPSAQMSFYKVVSEEEVSGREVKLSDTLIMSLQLGAQWMDDFDIQAKYCVASDIMIIDNYCSTDTDLFPNFSKIKNGYLMSEFGAFRTTDLNGSPFEMNFTCVVKVCKDTCDQVICENGESGWGRKRRSSEDSLVNVVRRQTSDEFDIDVGGKVKIVERYSDILLSLSKTEGACPQFLCPTPCPNGYVTDSNGCQICDQCLSGNVTQSGGALNPAGGFDVTPGQQQPGPGSFKPCIPGTSCSLDCNHGYFKGPRGCDFCICAVPASSNQLSYNDPCVDAPDVCDVTCTSGYVTGVGGCQYCRCKNHEATTTPQVVTSTSPSQEACILHYTKCQLQHPFGFMSDSDCTLCIDKEVIYSDAGIPEERQPTILLSNPCIQGFDICRLFCSSGYKSGPRSCHFCACQH